jgi:ankyrin repeat protein
MGNVELVKVFLAAKADVQSTTRDGATALTEAIRGGHEEVVGLLRAAGADAAATPVERPMR